MRVHAKCFSNIIPLIRTLQCEVSAIITSVSEILKLIYKEI